VRSAFDVQRSMFSFPAVIPFLTYPLALLALGSLPALAAIYFFRNRFRRRKVSSLMLWRFQVQSKEGGVKMNRIQPPPRGRIGKCRSPHAR
jgi:hypothetical protein